MLTSTEHLEPTFIRRHRILIGVIAVLVALYGTLGFLWLPTVIRNQAIGYVDKEMHKRLSLGEVTFNPFTLSLHVTKIKLNEANDIPIATVNDLLVNVELSSLWRRAYVFKQVRIEAPALNAIIDSSGNLNLANLKPASSAPSDNEPTTLPRIRINQFELLQGQVKFADASHPKPFDAELKPITFTLQNFRTEPDHENAFHFAAVSDEKETLDWRGDFTLQPFTANGELKIGALKATTIQSYLQDKLPFQLLDGTVTLDGSYELKLAKTLSFKLKLPNITASNARIAPKATTADAAEAWLTLPEVKLSDTNVSLQDQNVTIKSIAIQNADIKAVLDDKRNLNLLQLLGSDTEKSDAPWHAKVDDIQLDGASIHTTDQGVKPTTQFTLSPVQVHLQNFSTAPGTLMNVDAKLNVDGPAELTAKGSVQLDTQESQLAIQLNNFSLPSLQNYFSENMDLIVQEGKVTSAGNFNYKGNAKNKNPLVQYSGWVNIDGLATQDKADESAFIKWKQVQLLNFKYAMSPDQLIIDQVVVHQPYIRMAINANSTTNVQQILRQAPRSDSAPANTTVQDTPPTMKIRIGKVTIDKGVTDFSDDSVKPGFATSIQNLAGEVNGMSSKDETRATVNLQGSVDNYAPVSISGEANFLSASTFSDLSLKFRNIELTTFNPYSGKYAGYDIDKGKLTTEIHYSIVDRKLTAQHHVILDQLEFGKATDSKDAVSIPVKLAVALLKDRNGVIELDLPVGGSLDDPDFRIGPIVWKVVKNLLTKIVTSPFAALGSMFGSSEELAFVDFPTGAATLSDTEKEKLNKLSRALVERPQLKLNISLNVFTDADAEALSQAALTQAVAKHLPKTGTPTAQQQLDALIAVYKEKTGNAPEFSSTPDKKADAITLQTAALRKQLTTMFVVGEDERNELATQRANAVQDALLSNTELAPERIFKVGNLDTVKAPAGAARMELKLE